MDRAQLADFLRARREALQPEDVGLPRGPRRRTGGLRREEVAALSGMSTDYYGRLEQRRSPQPSTQMLTAMARGLRLTLAERDHLFRLAGHDAPLRAALLDHVSPALMRVLDRLQDTPAQVLSGIGETLVQTPPAAALFGDETVLTGLSRAVVYRWFTDLASRRVYPEEDHPLRGRAFVADLRAAYVRPSTRPRAEAVVQALLEVSPEFAALWRGHEVGVGHGPEKRVWHPELGVMTLQCQLLHDLDQSQALLVFTATPGTEDYEKLALLSVIGRERLSG